MTIDTLNVGIVLGDRTGFFHLKQAQKFYVEFEPFLPVRSSPPCNFLVDEGSELWLSQDIRVIGVNEPAVQLDGHMSGVYNITLEEGRMLVMGEQATNARYIDGKYVRSPEGGCGCYLWFTMKLGVYVRVHLSFSCPTAKVVMYICLYNQLLM